MAQTVKAARQQELKTLFNQCFAAKNPNFQRQWNLLNEFLGGRLLSRFNVAWAAKAVIRFREAWPDDVEKQKSINFLDERVDSARKRMTKRKELREAEKAARAWKPGSPGRRPKGATPAVTPSPQPPAPGTDIWDRM